MDMIADDEERSEKIAIMQRFVDEGLASGVGSKSKEAPVRGSLHAAGY